MDRRTLDRLVPLLYAALVLASAFFFPSALAGISIFGALAMAAYYSALRQHLIPTEHAPDDDIGDAGSNRGE